MLFGYFRFGVCVLVLPIPLLKVLLAHAAGWACPIFRDVFECRSWSNSAFLVSLCRIVYISADDANILFHITFVYKLLAS